MTMEYNPKAYYVFKDSEGNILFTARGDENPLIEESITKGLPIYTTDKGEDYIYPFAEQDGNGVLIHNTDWFKESEEYLEWEYVWAPTIKNTEINPYTISVMNKVLNELSTKAAAKLNSSSTNGIMMSETTTQTTQQIQQEQWYNSPKVLSYGIVGAISVAIIIAIAVGFAKSVKHKIKHRDEFSGIGWALVNAIVGLGIVGFISVIIAYNSINKELIKIRDKRYKKYAKRQLKDFAITYGICFLIKIIVILIIYVVRYINQDF